MLKDLARKASDSAENMETNNRAPSRYAWLHQCLLHDISSGRYPVGSLLPTEAELSKAYGVSRHTVREATRRLVDCGMIRRQPRRGTVIISDRPRMEQPILAAALGSMKEFMEYTDRTSLEVFREERVTVKEDEARRMSCEPDSNWVVWHANRRLVDQGTIITYTRAMLRPEFERIKETLHGHHPSILRQLEDDYGQEVVKIDQEIEAALMPDIALPRLELPEGSLALRIIRSYRDKHERLLTLSDNYHIASSFRLLTTWVKGSGTAQD
ncbi:GntR family transcriptional regulator [Parapusillimonas sp. JC17]|uniref:GntR family transcriptional regulator n=1 Tax=Parapusillimonas sp. JC17 TaxID=3445768 RepID=UPI003F9EDA17